MSYCRECGGEISSDWNICPFCETKITHPEIRDSVIMGDIISNVNDKSAIISAVQAASTCTSCGSSGATLFACVNCKNIAHCEVCISNVSDFRRAERLCQRCEPILLSQKADDEEKKFLKIVMKNNERRNSQLREQRSLGKILAPILLIIGFILILEKSILMAICGGVLIFSGVITIFWITWSYTAEIDIDDPNAILKDQAKRQALVDRQKSSMRKMMTPEQLRKHQLEELRDEPKI